MKDYLFKLINTEIELFLLILIQNLLVVNLFLKLQYYRQKIYMVYQNIYTYNLFLKLNE
uniref:Uncharacterized protein n=1 Tax=viral metagenome TaxID=1070528 RepID=A0A6C0J3B8_9ZZZZ